MTPRPSDYGPVARFDGIGNGPLSGSRAGERGADSSVRRDYLSWSSPNRYPGLAAIGDARLIGGSSGRVDDAWRASDGSRSCRRPAGLPLETKQ